MREHVKFYKEKWKFFDRSLLKVFIEFIKKYEKYNIITYFKHNADKYVKRNLKKNYYNVLLPSALLEAFTDSFLNI